MSDAVRYVAVGDSFSEGVGDELPDGTVRGWADLVAQGWANARGERVHYANLAIRGRLAWPIVEEQLEPALALRPTHLSFNGGGNDMLRPGVSMSRIAEAFVRVRDRCAEEGVELIALSGANPSAGLPLPRLIQRRGDELSDAVLARVIAGDGVRLALNWPDRELTDARFWSSDRLHMNARGHHRVAARVLRALDVVAPSDWWDMPGDVAARMGSVAYYRAHVLPWVARRLARRSSGDGRVPKFPGWATIEPTVGGVERPQGESMRGNRTGPDGLDPV